MSQGNTVETGDQGRQQQQEPSITPAEVEAFASKLESVAGRLKEVAPLAAHLDDTDWVRAREALLILDHHLADELAGLQHQSGAVPHAHAVT